MQDENIRTWLDNIRVSPKTRLRYASSLNKYLSIIGHLPASREEAQQYVLARERDHKSANTVAADARALKRYMEWAKVPCERLEHPPSTLQEPEYLSAQEIGTLLEAGKGSPAIQCITALLYDTGARIGEILNLKVADVDFQGFLTVTRKGGRTERVPVTQFGIGYLSSFMSARKYERHPRLFGDWKYMDVWKEYKRICKKAGIKKFHPHMLRHSRAIDMRNQGVEWDIIAYQLGHVNPNMTMKIYARRTPEDLRRLVPTPRIGI